MNILITGSFEKKQLERLTDQGYEVTQYGPRDLIDENKLIKALEGKHSYIFGGDELATAEVIKASSSLRHIAFLGAGYERFINTKIATESEVIVTNTPGANKQAVVEMAIGLIISARRKIPYLDRLTRTGVWNTDTSHDIKKSTIGIIGMGNIGSHLARILHNCFDMNILYYSQSRKEILENEIGAKKVSLDELVTNSDIVSIHAAYDPENPSTEGMIGEHEFSLMKKDAVLINTARAEIVDGKALYEALTSEKIECAAFDGYYTEPEPPTSANDPYGLISLESDKFIITPHIAWRTRESDLQMCEMVADAIIAIHEGNNDYPYIVN